MSGVACRAGGSRVPTRRMGTDATKRVYYLTQRRRDAEDAERATPYTFYPLYTANPFVSGLFRPHLLGKEINGTTGTNKTNETIIVLVVVFYLTRREEREGRALSRPSVGCRVAAVVRRVGTRALPCVTSLGRDGLRPVRLSDAGRRLSYGRHIHAKNGRDKERPSRSPLVLRGYVSA